MNANQAYIRRIAEENLLYFSAYFMGPDYLDTYHNPHVTFEDIVVFMARYFSTNEVG